ncbi:MAG: DUF533 domain-containing protein [Synechococcales bacterium]|nr:DUF533 domain-containing protein [Synechococcales bacterium]
MQPLEENLARLRVLVWMAQADGEIQPWEKTILNQALRGIPPSGEGLAPLTLDRLLSEPFSIPQTLAAIQSPETRRATYEEAVAIAQLDGLTPTEERYLAQIRKAFGLPDEAQPVQETSTARERSTAVAATDAVSGEGKGDRTDTDAVIYPTGARPDQTDSSVDWSAPTVSGRGIVLGMRRLIDHSRQVRSLVLDYALGAALIGLVPIPQLLALKLLGVAVLIFKMLRDIGSRWGFPKGADGFALIGSVFGFIGAWAIAFMAWLTVLGLGLIYPSIRALSLAAALSAFTWSVGQVTNHYYMSCSRLDVTALRRVLQRQAQPPVRLARLRQLFRR